MEADGAAFDIFIDRGHIFTYIDFKGSVRNWPPDTSFTLQTFTLHPDKNGHVSDEKIDRMLDSFKKGFDKKTDLRLSFQLPKEELFEQLAPEELPKETPTLVFSGTWFIILYSFFPAQTNVSSPLLATLLQGRTIEHSLQVLPLPTIARRTHSCTEFVLKCPRSTE